MLSTSCQPTFSSLLAISIRVSATDSAPVSSAIDSPSGRQARPFGKTTGRARSPWAMALNAAATARWARFRSATVSPHPIEGSEQRNRREHRKPRHLRLHVDAN